MQYEPLLANARDAFNLARSKLRLVEATEFKLWWAGLPEHEQARLGEASAYTLRSAFVKSTQGMDESCAVLRRKASQLGVPYYSWLSKPALVEAIKEKEKEHG